LAGLGAFPDADQTFRWASPPAARGKKLAPSNLGKLIAIPALLIAVQALITITSMNLLSIVRVYVEEQGLWSQSQAKAVFFLDEYLHHGEESDYLQFRKAIAAPLDTMAARRRMESPTPDAEAATAALLRTGMHADEIPGALWLFRNFHDFSYLRRAVAIWREIDAPLLELAALGDSLHAQWRDGPEVMDLRTAKARVVEIDRRLHRRARRGVARVHGIADATQRRIRGVADGAGRLDHPPPVRARAPAGKRPAARAGTGAGHA
jgi:hypothetical protein